LNAVRADRHAGPEGGLVHPNGIDVSDEHHNEVEARRAEVIALLDTLTSSVAIAFDTDGKGGPWPGSLPGTFPVVEGRTLVDLTVSADHINIVHAWRDVFHTGSGTCSVRLLNQPERPLQVVMHDLMATDGVMVAVLWAEDGGSVPLGEVPSSRARVGAIYQTIVGSVVSVDAGYTSMTGWTTERVLDRPSLEAVHPDDHTAAIDAWMDMMQSGRSHPRRWRTRTVDGNYLWTEIVIRRLPEGSPEGDVLVEVTDMTDAVAARERLEVQELLLNRMAQVVPVGLFQVALDGAVVYANDRLHHMLGTDAADESLTGQLATVVEEDRQRVVAGIKQVLETGEDRDVEGEVRPADGGQPRRCIFAVRPLRDRLDVLTGAIVCVSDITETARRLVTLERDLIHRSFHDALTGLPNRTLLINGMVDAIADSRESGTEVAVLLVDLDGFKAINDTLGHSVGDELLRGVSDRIRALVRPSDMVARVGGDEFTVLMDDFIDPDHRRAAAGHVLPALRDRRSPPPDRREHRHRHQRHRHRPRGAPAGRRSGHVPGQGRRAGTLRDVRARDARRRPGPRRARGQSAHGHRRRPAAPPVPADPRPHLGHRVER
jgi:PAS domain S-box-containing protein